MEQPPPPPPPPPHGSPPPPRTGPRSGGLPDGKYDIFVIPPSSAGSGFLYLPSLQVQRNSFLAGVACTATAFMIYQHIVPVVKEWLNATINGGGSGVVMLMLGVGVISWAFGKTQGEGATPNSKNTGGSAGSSHTHSTGTGYTGPPPQQHQQQQHQQQQNQQNQHQQQQDPNQHQQHQQAPPPPPPPPQSPPPPNDPPPKPSWQRPPPSAKATADAKSSWEKAREETRKREEQKRREEEIKRRREELEKERLRQREKETRERLERELKEKRERELKDLMEKRAKEEKERKEREEREKREKEQKERLEQLEKERLERLEKLEKEKAEAEAASAAAAAAAAAAKASPKRPPIPTAKTERDDDAYSFRPYDRPRKSNKAGSAESIYSEGSYAASATTAKTTPPASERGPYTTKDPDKIVIKAVYSFNNAFLRTPIAQLISGQGHVTDGLILRITTEGLFIDDDVRGVPQREWDVKAWTMKLAESCETSGMHVLRASIRDQEGKKYVFILSQSEGWKVAVGLQRLRRGTQVRALGVTGLPQNEAKLLLDNLGWSS